MKKDVIIQITAKQMNDAGEKDNHQFVTTGHFFMKDGIYYIMYNESAVTGMEGTSTTLKAEPDKVTLNRMGANQHKQVYEEGCRHTSNYSTPYGLLNMAVTASKVTVNLTDNGGSINLKYELELDNQKLSDNTLLLYVREA